MYLCYIHEKDSRLDCQEKCVRFQCWWHGQRAKTSKTGDRQVRADNEPRNQPDSQLLPAQTWNKNTIHQIQGDKPLIVFSDMLCESLFHKRAGIRIGWEDSKIRDLHRKVWDFHGKVWDFHAGTTHGPLSRSHAKKLRKERETISPTHVHNTRLWESLCYMKGRGKNFLSNSHRWKRHSMLWSTTNRWMGISSLFVLHCFALMSVEPHFNLHLRRLPWCCLTSSDSNEKCASNLAFAGGKVWGTAKFAIASASILCTWTVSVASTWRVQHGSTVVSERGYNG